MPSTWALITIPMMSSSAPPWCMCSGVITITAIITAWARASVVIPVATPVRVRITSRTRDHFVPVSTTGAPPVSTTASRATRSGSGRRNTMITTAEASMPTTPNMNGPVNGGSPRFAATSPAKPVRLGPATAPMVVAHTTSESALARRCGLARSVAAYLDWLFAAVVEPSSAAPNSSVGKESMTPASTASPAPAAPSR